MTDILHAAALAPATLGACCVAVDRGRARSVDLAASLLMMIAMLDAALTRVVPAVWWSALLLASAVVYAVLTRARRPVRGARGSMRANTAMSVHTGIGLVVMAALLLLMTSSGPTSPGQTSPGSSAHAHGSLPAAAVVLPLLVAYVGASAWLARRGPLPTRLQYAAMGTATAVMGMAGLS